MENIIPNILDALVPIIITTLASFFAWLGTRIKKYYDEKAKNEILRDIISSTVKYVEQVYKDIHGPEKLEEARTIACDWLAEKGIKVGDVELTILIESFVNGLNTSK